MAGRALQRDIGIVVYTYIAFFIWVYDINRLSQEEEERIFTIRGKQVILDRDLARLYGVDISQMNRQVKRNQERFPDDFMFQLAKEEWIGLKCHFGISNSRGGDRSLPFAFTEQGVSMLAGLLRSSIAIEANIRIIRAFVALRKAFKDNELILHRIERIEYRQSNAEFKIEELFNKIEDGKSFKAAAAGY